VSLCKTESLRFAVALICGAAFLYLGTVEGRADSFHNLDFEWAVIGTPVYYELPASEALPYWTNNNGHAGYVVYDTLALDSNCISIHDGYGGVPRDFNPLQGQYTVMLQTSSEYTSPPFIKAWISQIGDIPSDARSITFLSDRSCPTLSLNGTAIVTSVYNVGPIINQLYGAGPVTTFIGDIRAFSGQHDVELRFESTSLSTLDAITFSTLMVPEPSTFILLGIGAISLFGFAWWRRRT
jgi:hypothetical protein